MLNVIRKLAEDDNVNILQQKKALIHVQIYTE